MNKEHIKRINNKRRIPKILKYQRVKRKKRQLIYLIIVRVKIYQKRQTYPHKINNIKDKISKRSITNIFIHHLNLFFTQLDNWKPKNLFVDENHKIHITRALLNPNNQLNEVNFVKYYANKTKETVVKIMLILSFKSIIHAIHL